MSMHTSLHMPRTQNKCHLQRHALKLHAKSFLIFETFTTQWKDDNPMTEVVFFFTPDLLGVCHALLLVSMEILSFAFLRLCYNIYYSGRKRKCPVLLQWMAKTDDKLVVEQILYSVSIFIIYHILRLKSYKTCFRGAVKTDAHVDTGASRDTAGTETCQIFVWCARFSLLHFSAFA